MPGEWYCKISGETSEPLSARQLKALADEGRLGPNDLVRHGNHGPWIPAVCVKGLMPGDASSSELPEAFVTPEAEVAKRGPAKYAGKPAPKPSPRPAPPRKAMVIPVAQAEDEPVVEVGTRSSAAEVPHAPPRPAPRRSAPSDSAPRGAARPSGTARAGSLTAANPRRRKRNNVAAMVVLGIAAVTLSVVGVIILSSQKGRSPASDARTPDAAEGKADGAPAGDQSAVPEEKEWIDASKTAIKRDDARVQIRAVGIGVPPSTFLRTSNKYLWVTVELKNISAEKALNVRRWSDPSRSDHGVTIVDSDGKSYRQVPEPYGETPEERSPRSQSPKTKAKPKAEQEEIPPLKTSAARRATTAGHTGRESACGGEPFRAACGGGPFRCVGRLASVSSFGVALADDPIRRRPAGGRTGLERLPSGESIEDLLLFEPPGGPVKYLRLTLPAEVFGSKGNLYFQISEKMLAGEGKPNRAAKAPPTWGEEPAPGGDDVAESSKPDHPAPKEAQPAPKEKVDEGEKEFKELEKDLAEGGESAEDDNGIEMSGGESKNTTEKGLPHQGGRKGDKRNDGKKGGKKGPAGARNAKDHEA
jgi:hypothetical protein